MIDPLEDLKHNPLSPINEREEVKEFTKLELFQDYVSENNVPDVIIDYIQELENSIFEKNKALEELILGMRTTNELTYYINQLNKISKL